VPDAGGWQTMPLLRELAFVLRRTRPDIVHAHMVAGACLAWLLRPLGGYRLVTTLHNAPGSRSRLMGLGDRVIAVSDALQREMREKGFASHKLRVVHSGTEVAAQETTRLEHPAIVALAGLDADRGIDTLIEAFAALRNTGMPAHLYILGAETEVLENSMAASGHRAFIHPMGSMVEVHALAETLQATIGERGRWPAAGSGLTDGSAERMARETIAVYHEARALKKRRAMRMPVPQGALPQ
jgi:glycosyltransferase involved in cell wall biosynthesis